MTRPLLFVTLVLLLVQLSFAVTEDDSGPSFEEILTYHTDPRYIEYDYDDMDNKEMLRRLLNDQSLSDDSIEAFADVVIDNQEEPVDPKSLSDDSIEAFADVMIDNREEPVDPKSLSDDSIEDFADVMIDNREEPVDPKSLSDDSIEDFADVMVDSQEEPVDPNDSSDFTAVDDDEDGGDYEYDEEEYDYYEDDKEANKEPNDTDKETDPLEEIDTLPNVDDEFEEEEEEEVEYFEHEYDYEDNGYDEEDETNLSDTKPTLRPMEVKSSDSYDNGDDNDEQDTMADANDIREKAWNDDLRAIGELDTKATNDDSEYWDDVDFSENVAAQETPYDARPSYDDIVSIIDLLGHTDDIQLNTEYDVVFSPEDPEEVQESADADVDEIEMYSDRPLEFLNIDNALSLSDIRKMDEIEEIDDMSDVYGITQPYGINKGVMCKTCVNFAGQALNQLLNIILQGGVVGGCSALCSQVPGSSVVKVTCNILCDVVGVKAFIKMVQKADLDPIYYCQLLTACPYNDHGDATFTSVSVSPNSGPQGTFTMNFQFTSENGTSTGQFSIAILTVDGNPMGGSFLMPEVGPGSYNANVNIKAKPDKSCDPTQNPCEQWLPGTYSVKIAVCAGECGSKHPHSKVYDQSATKFHITSSNKIYQ